MDYLRFERLTWLQEYTWKVFEISTIWMKLCFQAYCTMFLVFMPILSVLPVQKIASVHLHSWSIRQDSHFYATILAPNRRCLL